MTQLHTLTKIVETKKKRLGRGLGSGAGAKSGRGTTRHQKARGKIPLHFEGGQNRSVKRYPLLRGKGRNKSVQPKAITINLDDVSVFEANATVTVEALIEKQIIDMSARKRGVKMVSSGTISVPLQIALPVSRVAKDKIEQAGGAVVVL
ncbi:50S ribosomal protein L15 [Candidatus Woesebacteria bacterium]|jgi:large subunit ribosomal protein L15|nr:50S ribosomal protein L15 [Candidatus Woesebacteria bacterium]